MFKKPMCFRMMEAARSEVKQKSQQESTKLLEDVPPPVRQNEHLYTSSHAHITEKILRTCPDLYKYLFFYLYRNINASTKYTVHLHYQKIDGEASFSM